MDNLIPIVVPMQVSVSNVEIPMTLSVSEVAVPMNVAVSYQMIDGQPYTGETEVESLLYEPYYLQTKNKVMPENVTVLPITILDVDNPAGGYTVTIGKF